MTSSRKSTEFKPVLTTRGSRRSNKAHRGDVRRARKAMSKIPGNPMFMGAVDELRGHVYSLGYMQADTYVKTTKEIALYVGKKYKNGGDVKRSIDQLAVATIPRPNDLPVATPAIPAVPADPTAVPPVLGSPAVPAVPGPTQTEERIWQREVDDYVKRVSTLERNLENLYSLIWLQCEPAMQDKIKTLTNYQTMKDDCDSLSLLKAIREVTFSFESQKYQPVQIVELNLKLASMKQTRNMTNSQYLEKFTNHLETMEACGATIGYSESMVSNELANMSPPTDIVNAPAQQYKDACDAAKEKYLAAAFLMGADETRYGAMMETLQKDFLSRD